MIYSLLLVLDGQSPHKGMTISDPSARKIVEAMYKMYAGCKTYQDTGTLVLDDGRISFTTRFSRPNRFYLEYTSVNYYTRHYAVWATGSKVTEDDAVHLGAFVWDNLEWKSGTRALGPELRRMAGVSLGVSNTVSNLLMPDEVGDTGYCEMTDMRIEGQATIRGVRCDVLASKQNRTRIWVGTKKRLLMREEEDFIGIIDDSKAKRLKRTDYYPILDAKIPNSKFTFKPPKQNRRTTRPNRSSEASD